MTLFDAVSKHEIFAEAMGFYSEGRDPEAPWQLALPSGMLLCVPPGRL